LTNSSLLQVCKGSQNRRRKSVDRGDVVHHSQRISNAISKHQVKETEASAKQVC